MDIFEAARALGAAVQEDERYIAYAKAKLANDDDAELQKSIGEFNVIRMNLEQETAKDPQDEAKVKELNEKLRSIYSSVMASKSMLEYNNSKANLDALLNDINSIIMQCIDGADPKTCEPEKHDCSGSCSSCSGCH